MISAKQAVNDAAARRKFMESGQKALWSRTCGASSHRLNSSPAGRRADLTFGLLSAPCHGAEGKSRAGQGDRDLKKQRWWPAAKRAKPLYLPGAPWHQRPKGNVIKLDKYRFAGWKDGAILLKEAYVKQSTHDKHYNLEKVG